MPLTPRVYSFFLFRSSVPVKLEFVVTDRLLDLEQIVYRREYSFDLLGYANVQVQSCNFIT